MLRSDECRFSPPVLRRGGLYLLPLSILVLAVAARIAVPGLLDRGALVGFDLYQRAAPRKTGNLPIRIVDIDDASLKETGTVALAARHHLQADRQFARCRRVGYRVRHRLRRTGPHLAAHAAAVAGAERPVRRGDRQAAGERSGSRRQAGRDNAHGAGRYRVHPERSGKRTRTRREGGVRVCRRRSSQPRRALFAGDPEPSRVRGGRGRKRLSQSASRLGQCGPAGPARLAARRQTLPVAGRRNASGRGRGAQLCRPRRRRPERDEFRREYRDDRPAHRSADRADGCRRPGRRAFRAAAAQFVCLGERHTGRHVRPFADRPEHRPGRDVGHRGDQRSPGDAARPECSGGRSPRATDRADPAGRLSRPPGLGDRGGNPVRAADRRRADLAAAAHRRAAQRGGGAVRGDRRRGGILAGVPEGESADRRGLPEPGADVGLYRRVPARLSAYRNAPA